MLRIDTHQSGQTHVDVQVSGRLGEDTIQQLALSVDSHISLNRHVFLDLGGVTAADHDGVAELLRLADEGVRLARCPSFLTLWLRAECRTRIREAS